VAEGNVTNSFHYVNNCVISSTPSAVTIRKHMKDKFTLKTHTKPQSLGHITTIQSMKGQRLLTGGPAIKTERKKD